jgi:hypothetical protein
MDLGGGSGLSTADQSMAASGTTGSISGGFSGPSGGGGDNNDPYQGFVQASQPRGLSAIQRAVQNTVQKTKDFLSQPANKRGIIGSLIGGALFGPFGAFVGGSIGQRYGGNVSNFFNPTVNTDDTEIDMLTRAGLLPNQLTMPIKQAGITGIDIPNFDPNMNLYATRPTSGYEDPDRAKEKDDALEKFYQENPEFRPPEESGINKLQFIV